MEYTFENQYTMNKSWYFEYVSLVLFKGPLLVCLLFVFFSILFMFLKGQIFDILIFFILFVLFFSYFLLTKTVKSLIEVSKRLNNGVIKKTVVHFGEHIEMDEGIAHLEFQYSQIKDVVKTKNFIVLKLSCDSAILVLKNGFTRGSEKDFLEFIQTRIN